MYSTAIKNLLRTAMRSGNIRDVLRASMSVFRSNPGTTRAVRNLNKPFRPTPNMNAAQYPWDFVNNEVPFSRPLLGEAIPNEGFRVWPMDSISESFPATWDSPPPWMGRGIPPRARYSTIYDDPYDEYPSFSPFNYYGVENEPAGYMVEPLGAQVNEVARRLARMNNQRILTTPADRPYINYSQPGFSSFRTGR